MSSSIVQKRGAKSRDYSWRISADSAEPERLVKTERGYVNATLKEKNLAEILDIKALRQKKLDNFDSRHKGTIKRLTKRRLEIVHIVAKVSCQWERDVFRREYKALGKKLDAYSSVRKRIFNVHEAKIKELHAEYRVRHCQDESPVITSRFGVRGFTKK